MCILFPGTPPRKENRKGAKNAAASAMIDKQDNPNTFKTGMKDAPCAEPCCCCIGTIGAPCGFTACWTRNTVLKKYDGGIESFLCCQGYCNLCGNDFRSCCPGSPLGLCLEGCCCPVLSVSIARMHLMDVKRLQPDPCDYQLIQCSNCLQMLSCICHILAIFIDGLKELAIILDIIADCFTMSVTGCMAAQLHHETKDDAPRAPLHSMQRPSPAGAPPMMQGQAAVAGAPVPMAMARAQAPQPQVFMVQLPPGAMAGQQMMITSPFTGQDMTVVVPMGVPPGGQFQVQG